MRYGYFDEEQREYVITRPDTPAPWVNYLGSPKYGAIISNNAGGYSFAGSGADGRILRYIFNHFDEPGRYLYIRDNDSKDYWSASWQPVGKDLLAYKSECRHGTAYTKMIADYSGIHSEALYYVPLDKEYEVWDLRLENQSDVTRSLTVTGYAEFTNNSNYEQDQVNLQYSKFITRTVFRENRVCQKIHGNLDALKEGENMLLNPDFAEGDKNWENAVTAPGEAKVSFEGKKAVYEISNVGTADWNVQLKQSGITLEKGSKYKVSFKAASTEERAIKVAMLSAAYDWYGGADIALSKEEKLVEFEFVMEKDTDANTIMVVSMGKIDEQDTPLSMITLSDFTLEKVS